MSSTGGEEKVLDGNQQAGTETAPDEKWGPTNNDHESPKVKAASSNNEGRKISCEDIQLVQNLIERCLQLYMNQSEVIDTLKFQAKIEPGFTSLVWQKLEEQNPDFFKAYYTRLKVKKQIVLLNHLMEQHVQLTRKMRVYPPAMNQMVQPMQNGMQPAIMHMSQMAYPMQPGPSNSVRPHMGVTPMQVPNTNLMNGASPVQEYAPPHSSPGSAPMFPFGNMGNPTDIQGMQMGLNTSMSLDTPFISTDPVQNGMGALSMSSADADSSGTRESLESLGQLPRNFSLSDLTAELDKNPDLEALGNYTGSPFLTSDTEAFLQSPDKEFSGLDDDDKMLDTIDLDFDDDVK